MPIEKPLTDGIDLAVLLPAQSELRTGPHFAGPIAKLAVAVLQMAVMDARIRPGANSRQARIRDDAIAWIDGAGDEPFTVEWICDMLHLDLGQTRALIRGAIDRTSWPRRHR